MNQSKITPALLFAVFALFMQAITAPELSAQLGADPTETIRKLTEKIEEQMTEIDRLLLESGNNGASGVNERLGTSKTSSRNVVEAIDQLIEELDKMAQQGGGGGGGQSKKPSGSPPPGSGRDQPQGGQQGPRQENDTPQVGEKPESEGSEGQRQQQSGQTPGEQQQPNQSDGNPNGQEQPMDAGANTQTGAAAPQNPTDDFEREQTGGEWGNLPPYLMHLKSRGSPPQIPQKYRRLYEAYLRKAAKDGNTSRTPAPPARPRSPRNPR